MKATIAFIGSGNMAASLIGGLISDQYPPEYIWVSGPNEDKLSNLKNRFNVNVTSDNAAAVRNADIVVFAVKPQILKIVVEEVADAIQQKKPLVISIAAGIRESLIGSWLGGNVAIVRCMPNTPALVGCGATAMFANELVANEQRQKAESIMRAVGLALWLDEEHKLDVVTALSGSGPAYFFFIIELLQRAGQELGLSEQEAKLLTLQTALGAARMALESDQSASALRKAVTSPGGTTECALEILEAGHVDDVFAAAIEGATHRAKELSDRFI